MNGTMERVVVGYDGSEHGRRALQWAAAEAAARRAELEVICVVDDGGLGIRGPVGMAHWWTDVAADEGRRLTSEGADLVGQTWPDLDILPVGRAGVPASVLIDASRRAGLLVVGTRGRNPLAEMALGSVAEAVATHARCPVVVVHGDVGIRPGTDHPIVVGVDGSAGSRRALEIAARWAHVARASLLVVCAWTGADAWGFDALTATQESELQQSASRAARDAADAAVAVALELWPDLHVTGCAHRGQPSQVLTDLGADAALLVVGTRGRGAFASLLLGSVSHALVRTAPCAVAVIGEHASPDAGTHADETTRRPAVTATHW